jgi:16S rRNA C967 or C1407 C5-methylase (RsmB/RsmF family)
MAGDNLQPTSRFHRRLDSALQEFYDSHGIELSSLLTEPSVQKKGGEGNVSPFRYRFVRLNPRYDLQETLMLLGSELDGETEPVRVPWLPTDNFYALPGNFGMNSSLCFQAGRIYGMDVSSGASIAALLSNVYDLRTTSTSSNATIAHDSNKRLRVLDLCCCPGLKLCTIADLVPPGSTVIGVDISSSRMALCAKIVEKYHVNKSTSGRVDSSTKPVTLIQLYCQDGTSFGTSGMEYNLIFDSTVAVDAAENNQHRKRKNKSARARERKRLRQIVAPGVFSEANENGNEKFETDVECVGKTRLMAPRIELFDFVLVDAECSTDGSLKHLRERLKGGAPSRSNHLLTDEKQLADLVELQQRLLASGFRSLKPGGALVYSTCSLSQSQNEAVVDCLLKENEDAYLIPVEFSLAKSKLVASGSLQGTIRFYPNIGQQEDTLFGDGFFLAKIGKR